MKRRHNTVLSNRSKTLREVATVRNGMTAVAYDCVMHRSLKETVLLLYGRQNTSSFRSLWVEPTALCLLYNLKLKLSIAPAVNVEQYNECILSD